LIDIDGSHGEGGGQILRTSLSLSLITGQPLRIERIRAGRKNPGMMRQHLTCVLAAAEVGGAEVEGASTGSQALTFQPRRTHGAVKGGNYRFAIGTAGSTTLVLQTILVPLLFAKERSEITLEGGTHNSAAPSFDFLTRSFLPLLAGMGAKIDARLVKPGFYPAGGGKIVVTIEPAPLGVLQLLERGTISTRVARAEVANLPFDIAKREIAVIKERTKWPDENLFARTITGSAGPGNVVTIVVSAKHVTEVVSGFGARGVRAEDVAAGAVEEVERYLASTAAVGEHLADQLLLPMAVGGGGVFTTLAPTLHTRTNAEVIQKFGVADVRIEEDGDRFRVTVASRGTSAA
jgi:RNA 3'-terminal phosphate cyclase (ATP)